MNYFYSKLFGVTGAILLSSLSYGISNKMHKPYSLKVPHQIHNRQSAFSSFGGIKTVQNTNPIIKMEKGSFSADLKKWNLNEKSAIRNLNSWLGLNANYSFEQFAEETDRLGIKHTVYQGFYKGIPVDNAMVILHSKDGKAHFINGRLTTIKSVNIHKNLLEEEALAAAMNNLEVTHLIKEYPIETVITKLTNENEEAATVLTYKVKIVSGSPLVMHNIYVDAQTGKIVKSVNLIKDVDVNGTGETLYKGNQEITCDDFSEGYRLRESDRNIETYDASNLTEVSYVGDFIGVTDYVSSTPDFAGTQLENFEISEDSIDQNGGDLYLKIKNDAGETKYTSNFIAANSTPIIFNNIDYVIYNSPYSAEIWQENATGSDELLVSIDLNLSEGVHQWSSASIDGDYTSTSIANPALDVHWGMEQTHDFYLNVFGRDSYDDNGGVIKQYVDPPAHVVNAYLGQTGLPNNAFALESPFNVMVFGLGDGQVMNPVIGLDVEGHEFSHLVIDHNLTGGLNYQGESGALNESFADIFGTCVEFYSGVNPNWTIGEDIPVNGDNLRSMSNPKNPFGLSQQPDTYEGNLWADPNSYYDNGGVHINSGVQNHWFYLLAEGGSGINDLNDEYDVNGIGIEKAREIAYQTVMSYLTPNASYLDAYSGSLQAAKDLYGIPSEEYSAVSEAWYAVGIGDNPNEYCGGLTDLTEQTGTFDDGSGQNEDYVNNAHCTWLIHPDDADFISLVFSEFDTETNADYVVVYDGSDNTAPVLGEFSGSSTPEGVVSTGGSMYVEFYSDQSNVKGGWTAHYATNELGVESHTMKNQLMVYPNPNNGDFTVDSGLDGEAELQIFDISGKQVSKTFMVSKGENSINAPELNTGIYFLKFKSGAQTHVEKIVVK